MKWFLIFFAGALCGAYTLFLFLNNTPPDSALPRSPPVAAAPISIPEPVTVLHEPSPATTMTPAIPASSTTVTFAAQPSAPAFPVVMPPVAGTDAKPADKLLIPVTGVKASQLTDTFNQPRGFERSHEAIDILAPKGTQVVAVVDGKVVKLFNSKAGGLTVYQFDTSENFAYYYAHLDRYASGVAGGTLLRRGDLIGYVGTTGNADPAVPHLHFAIFELTSEKQWWKGKPLNPYPLLRE